MSALPSPRPWWAGRTANPWRISTGLSGALSANHGAIVPTAVPAASSTKKIRLALTASLPRIWVAKGSPSNSPYASASRWMFVQTSALPVRSARIR